MNKTFLLLAASMFVMVALSAQSSKFLRIFDLSGKKIAKGYFSGTTDSSIKLSQDSSTMEYSAAKIGLIKTKRSGGHAILIASAAGGVGLGLVALAANSSDNSNGFIQLSGGEVFVGGLLYGAALGTITGGIISAANKRMTYQINGDLKKWMEMKGVIEK